MGNFAGVDLLFRDSGKIWCPRLSPPGNFLKRGSPPAHNGYWSFLLYPNPRNTLALLVAPVVIAVAGCGGRVSATDANAAGEQSGLSIHAAVTHIDTNRTTRYTATLANGEPASVEWSV